MLTADRIMHGLIRDLPNLITCSGFILARGENRVAGEALALAQELVDLQRGVLPSRYSEPFFVILKRPFTPGIFLIIRVSLSRISRACAGPRRCCWC